MQCNTACAKPILRGAWEFSINIVLPWGCAPINVTHVHRFFLIFSSPKKLLRLAPDRRFHQSTWKANRCHDPVFVLVFTDSPINEQGQSRTFIIAGRTSIVTYPCAQSVDGSTLQVAWVIASTTGMRCMRLVIPLHSDSCPRLCRCCQVVCCRVQFKARVLNGGSACGRWFDPNNIKQRVNNASEQNE